MVAILSHLFGCVCYTAKTDTLAALFVVLLAQVSLTVLGSKVFFFLTSQRIYCLNIGMKQQREPQVNPVCGLGTEGRHY